MGSDAMHAKKTRHSLAQFFYFMEHVAQLTFKLTSLLKFDTVSSYAHLVHAWHA